ncbi:MAG: Calx-beta domain-containing protein, partial [Pseudomonadota bacterium]
MSSTNHRLQRPILIGLLLVLLSALPLNALAAVIFFQNDQAGFDAARAGTTFVGLEDFESSTNNSGGFQTFDDPLLPGVASAPNPWFPNGTNPTMGMTIQSNTLGGNPSMPAPNIPPGIRGLVTAPPGFLGTPTHQISNSQENESFDMVFGLAGTRAVSFVPLIFDVASSGDSGTATIRIYDTGNNLIDTLVDTPVAGFTNPTTVIGVVATGADSIGRINVFATSTDDVYSGADNIRVYTGPVGTGISLTASNSNPSESAGSVTLTATASAALASNLTVTLGYSGTADSGGDYTGPTSITIPAGLTTGSAILTLVDDGTVEADETIVVDITSLSDPTTFEDTPNQQTITIENDDSAVVTVADVAGNEDDGAITVTATLSNTVDNGFDVDVSTTDGSATTADNDYTAVTNFTLTFTGTMNEIQTFTVTPTADATTESDETVSVSMSDVMTAVVSPSDIDIADVATVTILNDDAINLSVNDPTASEANPLQFTISLSAPAPAGGASVDVSTSDGTAAAGSDYTALSGSTVNFPPGGTNAVVNVTVNDDSTVEADETVTLTLSNPVGTDVMIADAMGSGTIANNDLAVVSVADVAINESAGLAAITLTSSAAVDDGFSVDVSTIDNTATAGDDYTALFSEPAIFSGAAGETQFVSVTVSDDAMVEADESLDITLGNVITGTVDSGDIDATDTATITILNDDIATLTIADVSGNEDDGAVTVTVELSSAVDGGLDVDVSTVDGTATVADSDYTPVTSQTLSFSGTANEQQSFQVTPTADSTPELDETVSINMSNVIAGTVDSGDITISDTGTLTILNDDDVLIQINDVSQNETNAGTATLTFTVTLSQAPSNTVTVDYATADGTATGGVDYTSSSGTLTFLAGQDTQAIDINISGDLSVELDETFSISLSAPVNGIINDGTGLGTIINDDSAAVTIDDVASNEDDGTVTVTVSLENPVQGGFAVDVSTADGTATTADSDYTAVTSQTLNFTGNAGEVQNFDIVIATDSKLESDETLTVAMASLLPSNPNIDISDDATVTILNDDAAAITLADVSGPEDGGAITVTATLDSETDGSFSIDVSTTDGSATAGSDYTAVTQTLSFTGTAGETQTLSVTPSADTEAEGDETVLLSQSNLSGTTLAIDVSDGATLTIGNDDYTVGGQVSGLTGTGLVLSTNGQTLPISADGNFTFPNALADGTPYDVAVDTQPTAPIQICSVTNGSDNVNGQNVTNVQVDCVTQESGISLSLSLIDFGPLDLGETSTASLTVDSNGVNDLIITNITNPDAPFAVTGGSCTAVPVMLIPGTSCDITVEVTPLGFSGTLSS